MQAPGLGSNQPAEVDDLFHLMFEKHEAVMLLIEPDTGAILNANPAAGDYYGYSVETLRRMNIAEINILPPEEVARLRAQAAHENRNAFIFPHRLANGEVRTVDVHSSPVQAGGRIILFSIVHDITARQQAVADLQTSEQKFAAAFRASPDALIISRRDDGVIIEVNESWQRITGFSRDESLGQSSLALGIFPRLELREELIAKAAPRDEQWQLRCKSGELRWVSLSGERLTLQGQDCLLGILRDITERKQAEARLADQLEELRRWYAATLGRENRILELKREVNALLRQAGQAARYPSAEDEIEGE